MWRNARAGIHHGSSEAVRTTRRPTSATNTQPRSSCYFSKLFKYSHLPPTLASRMTAFAGGTRKLTSSTHKQYQRRRAHDTRDQTTSPLLSILPFPRRRHPTYKRHSQAAATYSAHDTRDQTPPAPLPSRARRHPLTSRTYDTSQSTHHTRNPALHTQQNDTRPWHRVRKKSLQYSHKFSHSTLHTCKSRGVVYSAP